MPGAIKEVEKKEATEKVETNGNGVHHDKIKSIVLTSTGSGSDYSNLQLKEEDYPKLDPNREDQVIVRMKAVGLNFAELMQRQGLYKPTTKTPYTPGYEGSGVVEEVGGQVTDIHVNDRVLAFNSSGIWKEVVIVPRSNVVKLPENMTFEDAAGLLVNYLTAYQILFRMTNIKPGNKVLIHMAAGGVGTAATQLCRTIPGVVVIGTASVSKHEAIKENGVDHAIDYTSQDYVAEIKKLFPEGIDVVLDPLNGENSIKGYELLKPLGRIVHFGAASITSESRSLVNAFKAWWKCLTINSIDMVSENKCVSGYHLGYLLNNPSVAEELKADMNALLDLYRDGKIKVKVDSTFGFSKIGEAMKRMHSRLNIGKIILKPDCDMPVEAVVPATTTDDVKIQTSPGDQPPAKAKVERNESKKSKKASKAETEIKKQIVDETTASPTEKTKSVVAPETLVAGLTLSPSVEAEKVEENLDDGTVPLTN